jgi:hypothetical protein
MMNEAQSIEAFDKIDYISDVFMSISDYLEEAQKKNSVETRKGMIASLIESPIFPIHAGKSEATFDYLSTADSANVWFIADRWHLRRTFEGLVPLLALKVEIVAKIAPLIKILGWECRLLSRLTQGVPQTGGRIQLDFEYTKLMCAKARYIAR